jgi:hypothetical protein
MARPAAVRESFMRDLRFTEAAETAVE